MIKSTCRLYEYVDENRAFWYLKGEMFLFSFKAAIKLLHSQIDRLTHFLENDPKERERDLKKELKFFLFNFFFGMQD